MNARLLADGLLIIHFAFILFVTFGGLWALYRPRLMTLHLPALAWGLWVQLFHQPCPLTIWEKHFRQMAGESGYQGGFIEHYLLPAIYPPGLTFQLQTLLGILLLGSNLLIYGILLKRLFSKP